MSKKTETPKKFVLLEGVIKENRGNRFFSLCSPNSDPTKGGNGETWYRILGYADTTEEAQDKLYGFHMKEFHAQTPNFPKIKG